MILLGFALLAALVLIVGILSAEAGARRASERWERANANVFVNLAAAAKRANAAALSAEQESKHAEAIAEGLPVDVATAVEIDHKIAAFEQRVYAMEYAIAANFGIDLKPRKED